MTRIKNKDKVSAILTWYRRSEQNYYEIFAKASKSIIQNDYKKQIETETKPTILNNFILQFNNFNGKYNPDSLTDQVAFGLGVPYKKNYKYKKKHLNRLMRYSDKALTMNKFNRERVKMNMDNSKLFHSKIKEVFL